MHIVVNVYFGRAPRYNLSPQQNPPDSPSDHEEMDLDLEVAKAYVYTVVPMSKKKSTVGTVIVVSETTESLM